jgi:hypothetical protein
VTTVPRASCYLALTSGSVEVNHVSLRHRGPTSAWSPPPTTLPGGGTTAASSNPGPRPWTIQRQDRGTSSNLNEANEAAGLALAV